MVVKRPPRRAGGKTRSAATKSPARLAHRTHGAHSRSRQSHASSMHFGKLIATAGLLIAAAASAAVFVPKPMLRDAKDKLGRNLVPLGNRVAELASRLAEDADAFGRSLRG